MHWSSLPKATLHLSHGVQHTGRLIGAPLTSRGEMVFTTSLVGYSESLSDPSYFGQILTFAYPLIGNYGVSRRGEIHHLLPHRGHESKRIHAAGIIITLSSPQAFHWNSAQTLHQWLLDQGVPGITCLDTRDLICNIREHTPLLGRIEPENSDGERQYPDFKLPQGEYFDPSEHQILPQVSTAQSVLLKPSPDSHNTPSSQGSDVVVTTSQLSPHQSPRIALIDCGVKSHILRMLLNLNCEVEVLPWDHPLEEVTCDGWVISNGPGDPMQATSLIQQITTNLLNGKKSVLGICLGHQLLGLAAGITSERMSYGHRSHNQPVIMQGTRKGFITSQNHGFHLVEDQNWPRHWEVWFRNANDGSIEGIKHKTLPLSSVQFHPESSGGPRDTAWILEDFVHRLTWGTGSSQKLPESISLPQ